jgi:hypothetical protein
MDNNDTMSFRRRVFAVVRTSLVCVVSYSV